VMLSKVWQKVIAVVVDSISNPLITFGGQQKEILIRYIAEQVYRLSDNPSISDCMKLLSTDVPNSMTEEDILRVLNGE
jgi:hypothetical protein